MRRRTDLNNHPLLLICLSQLCVSIGRNLVNPILPLYVSSFNVSYTVVGLVMSSFGMSRIFVEIPGGALTDRMGRKPIILLGYLLSITSHLIAGFAQTPLELAVSRMLMGTGSALMLTAGTVYVTERATKDARTRDLARFQSTLSIAGIVGPTLGGLISDTLGTRSIFFVAAVVSIIGVLLVLMIRSAEDISRPEEEASPSTISIIDIMKDRRMIVLSASCFMMFFLFSSIRGTMIPVYGTDVLKLSAVEIGLVFSLTSATTVVGLVFLTHRLEGHLGRAQVLVLALCVNSITVVLISFASNMMTLSAFVIPLGLGLSMLQPTIFAMISDYAEPGNRGLTMGISRTVAAFGIVIGPTMVGGLIDLRQPLVAFYLIAGLLGLFAILTHVVFGKPQVAG
jgi:DHA1 family multidrug resistance protein-like MFS transporter